MPKANLSSQSMLCANTQGRKPSLLPHVVCNLHPSITCENFPQPRWSANIPVTMAVYRALGGLAMLKRNHPTHPDPEAAAQAFFKANNTLDYINWADTMAVSNLSSCCALRYIRGAFSLHPTLVHGACPDSFVPDPNATSLPCHAHCPPQSLVLSL